MKLNQSIAGLLAAGALIVGSSQAMAWGELGHGAVGQIAERNLTEKAKAFVYTLVGSEPLAVSAVQPDELRDDRRFDDFKPFHFLEIPPQYTLQTLPKNLRAAQDADTIIAQVPALLAGTKISPQQKMLLYRFLVHVVGDVHQPLHVGNGLDRGANNCFVKWSATSKPSALHSVWDDGLIRKISDAWIADNTTAGRSPPWFGYVQLADVAEKEVAGVTMGSANKASAAAWYEESRALHSVVYPDGANPPQNLEDRAFCKGIDKATGKTINGNYDEAKVPVMGQAYIDAALPVIKKQILLAGYRLAGVLNDAAEDYFKANGNPDAAKISALRKKQLAEIEATKIKN